MSPQFGGFGRSAKTESNPLKLWYLTVLLICGILISAGCIVASHPPSSPPLPSAPLTIASTSLPAATAGSSYSTVLVASGGVTPYGWSATGLPAGLAVGTNTGQISGTPATAGNYTVTASVRDSENSPASGAVGHHGFSAGWDSRIELQYRARGEWWHYAVQLVCDRFACRLVSE